MTKKILYFQGFFSFFLIYFKFCEINIQVFLRYISDFIEYEKIAEGGFGAVYKARNILDENLYAYVKNLSYNNHSFDFIILLKSKNQKNSFKKLFISFPQFNLD